MYLQSLVALILFLPYQPALTPPWLKDKTMLQKVLAMDWIGTILSIGLTITLLLPLFWGGNLYAWSDAVVTGLFVAVSALARACIPTHPMYSPASSSLSSHRGKLTSLDQIRRFCL
jgi:hypothetical protein